MLALLAVVGVWGGLVRFALPAAAIAPATLSATSASAPVSAPPTTAPASQAASRPTSRPATRPAAIVSAWEPIFRGVAYAHAEAAEPRPIRAHVVRINLRAPGIEFFVTPSNGDRERDTDGLKPTTFLTRYKCQVAINASPFGNFVNKEDEPQTVVGLSISRGDRYAAPHDDFGALLISRDNKAWIVAPPPPYDTSNAYNAVGGFHPLLHNGVNVGKDDQLHPRSAVGISKNGRRLYFVVIDGRQAGYSEGTTTAETAEWMRLFGAYDALNLDGGGSTTLVIDDGHGGAKILNRPIHANVPGTQRIAANHLGVFARPLRERGDGAKP